MYLACIAFLVSLQHTSGSCSIIICIPIRSYTKFHWEIVAHRENCKTPGELWLWYRGFEVACHLNYKIRTHAYFVPRKFEFNI